MSGNGLVPWGPSPGVQDFSNPHECHQFNWSLGDILAGVLGAGLRIEHFREYLYSNGCKLFDDMVQVEGRRFVPSPGHPVIPQMFSLVARRDSPALTLLARRRGWDSQSVSARAPARSDPSAGARACLPASPLHSRSTMRLIVPLLVQGIVMLAAPPPAWTQPAAAPARAGTSRPPQPGPAVVGEPAGKSPRSVLLPGETQFNECLRLPRNGQIKVTLKPESEITDVIAWISSATCKGFIVAERSAAGRAQGHRVLARGAVRRPRPTGCSWRCSRRPASPSSRAGASCASSRPARAPRALLPICPGPGEAPDRDDGYVTRARAGQARQRRPSWRPILQGYRGESGAIIRLPARAARCCSPTAPPPSTGCWR